MDPEDDGEGAEPQRPNQQPVALITINVRLSEGFRVLGPQGTQQIIDRVHMVECAGEGPTPAAAYDDARKKGISEFVEKKVRGRG